MSTNDIGHRLETLVRRADGILAGVDEARAARRGRDAAGEPGWSARELLGHLIDSASNNHQRFVRAAFVAHLDFPGYEQNEWVAVQGYDGAPFDELRVLWTAYNLHLARVLERLAPEILDRPRAQHALDRIAWSAHPADRPATLRWFAEDYLGHLRHHLVQLGALVGESLCE